MTQLKICFRRNIPVNSISWDSLVGIATGYGLDGPGSIAGRETHSVETGSVAHPASYPMHTERSFSGVKRTAYEAEHSSHLMPRSRMVELYLHVLN
jgi:hypothetical protein